MAGGSGKTREKIVLTHRAIETLKPAADAYRVPDLRCPGLAIRVAPSGVRTWDFVTRLRGTKTIKRKSLGAFPAVSLDHARERAAALGRAAQVGRDLLDEEREAQIEAAARTSVAALIGEYVNRACSKLRTKHEIELRLRRGLASIQTKAAQEVKRRELRDIFNAINDRGAPREAEKCRQSTGAMFAWAVGQDIVDTNPVDGLEGYGRGELRDHVLSPKEIQVLWSYLETSDLAPDMSDCFRLQLCLGSRIGEIAGMCAEEIDAASWVWTLPAARSKNKKPRLTPLVGRARDIIGARLKFTRRGPLFVSERGNALNSNNLAAALVDRRKNIQIEHFVSHDIRRTVATQLVELGISFDLVAAVLGHEVGGANVRVLARHYIRTDQVDRKRVALSAWDARLTDIIDKRLERSNVVKLSDILRDAS